MAKAWVAPLKSATIPCLERCAVQIGARLTQVWLRSYKSKSTSKSSTRIRSPSSSRLNLRNVSSIPTSQLAQSFAVEVNDLRADKNSEMTAEHRSRPRNAKHPIILPPDAPFTHLLIKDSQLFGSLFSRAQLPRKAKYSLDIDWSPYHEKGSQNVCLIPAPEGVGTYSSDVAVAEIPNRLWKATLYTHWCRLLRSDRSRYIPT